MTTVDEKDLLKNKSLLHNLYILYNMWYPGLNEQSSARQSWINSFEFSFFPGYYQRRISAHLR